MFTASSLPELSITKIFTFEMAHALPHHEGNCKNIHGHSYRLHITISGKPVIQPGSSSDGMVMDFAGLKEIVQLHVISKFDHMLVLSAADQQRFSNIESNTPVVYVNFSPTCELLLVYICDVLKQHLPREVKLQKVRLDETATSYAEWNA